jgi:pyroglutamyl-peptidase
MTRVLVTGFGPFPGAPVNPTETLMRRLGADPPDLGPEITFTAEVIPTVYGTLPDELARLGALHRPDVAVHFGLDRSATGFRLERLARNRQNVMRVDAAGGLPQAVHIAEGLDDHPSRLPLDEIAAALTAAGLPLQWSDDCGDYLCNAMFFHAVAGLVEGYAPRIAGFIHVPLPGPVLSEAGLEQGARIIAGLAAKAGAGSS